MRHILSLEIPQTYNPKLLLVQDTSQYSSLGVDCGRLEIVSPGFNVPKFIEVSPGFNEAFSACDLDIQKHDCGDSQYDLPDGIYIIRYAVSPIDKVYVEYNHLRVTEVLNKYYKEFSRVRLETCTPKEEVAGQLKELALIKSYIEGAKANVEYAHKPARGIDLLKYANTLLIRFSKRCK